MQTAILATLRWDPDVMSEKENLGSKYIPLIWLNWLADNIASLRASGGGRVEIVLTAEGTDTTASMDLFPEDIEKVVDLLRKMAGPVVPDTYFQVMDKLAAARRRRQKPPAATDIMCPQPGTQAERLFDAENAERLAIADDALLEESGGSLSLMEAAAEMGLSTQELHERISAGTVLGMMRRGEIVVPKLQFVPGRASDASKKIVLDGIDLIIRVFDNPDAGPWSVLRFLVLKDPNLGRSAIDALRSGDIDAVEKAARAYLPEGA
jgi:hypothetical protein